MAGFNRGVLNTIAALTVTLLSNLAHSTDVVTGYWSDVSENEPVIQASLSPKPSQDPSESRLLKLNLAQLRDATNHTGSYIAEKAKVHAAFLLHLLGCLWPLTDPAIQSTRIYNPARLAPDACVHFSCRLVVQSARSVAS